VGIGDDAAVLHSAGTLVWTIDEQVDGIHFRRDLLSMRDVGFRSFMAATSDVAAMGATPWCALCSVVLPTDFADADLEAFARGQRDAAREVQAGIVGGNLSRGPALSVSTTVLGRGEHPVARAGARSGDRIWLAGSVGLAAAGLRALTQGLSDARLDPAVAAWRTPRALIQAGLALESRATAAIDVSDGLARDLGHVARASGLAAVLDEAALVEDGLLVLAAEALATGALDLALYGGEDYALVATSPVPLPGFRCIGAMRTGAGLFLRSKDSERLLSTRGFDHFAER
jgi:thiamine-monophosphate kinase